MSTALQGSTFEIRPLAETLPAEARAAKLENPGFGRIFTEHMASLRYSEGKGWHGGLVGAYEPLMMDPASSVLHYGQAIFEGFKAYHQPDGGIRTFRPFENARRFNTSARRLAMPELPEALFVEAADLLIRQDREWVPGEIGHSLYMRPLMIGTEAALGVRPSKEYLFLMLASPAGAYFAGGVKPVTVWVSPDYTRAAPGGTGAAKCGGNYATSLVAQAEAIEAGCDQVVFLDAVERRFVDELGGMNVFFVYDDDTLVTPPLTGTILPGITRDSVITLAGTFGYTVAERQYSIEQWQADAASGHLREAFACGTAAVITPIGTVRSADGEFAIGGGEEGPVTQRLRQTLVDIQRGRIADEYGWVQRIL